MQAIFNELSASQLAQMDESQASAILLNLIQVCKQLQVLDSTFKMRINPHFWDIQLDDYGSIRDYLTNNYDMSDDQYFLYAITDSPYLPDDIDINEERFLEENMVWKTLTIHDDSGIRTAYAFDPEPAPMISFATNDWRDINIITVEPESQPVVDLINIATTKQIFEIHFEAITTKYLKLAIGNPATIRVAAILPNKDITNEYLKYFQFYIRRNTGQGEILNHTISVTQIKEIGHIVAKINGWIRHGQYSIINKREVFSHSKKNTIFIAIDTEKGDFEVHSSTKGNNHLGAISFNGAKIEAPKGHELKFEHRK